MRRLAETVGGAGAPEEGTRRPMRLEDILPGGNMPKPMTLEDFFDEGTLPARNAAPSRPLSLEDVFGKKPEEKAKAPVKDDAPPLHELSSRTFAEILERERSDREAGKSSGHTRKPISGFLPTHICHSQIAMIRTCHTLAHVTHSDVS